MHAEIKSRTSIYTIMSEYMVVIQEACQLHMGKSHWYSERQKS